MDTPPVDCTSGAEVIPLGIYVRISDDGRDEDGNLTREGVKRQEADSRKLSDDLSTRLGMQIIIVRIYDDNNITAGDERITRPGFEQLLKDLESGVIQGFLFYHADRVARQELDAARVTRLYRVNPRLIGLSVTGGTDLSTDEGRATFMMQAVMGGMEVAATRRRVTRHNRALAENGKNHGGKRPFGWEADRKSLRQWEADLLASAIRDVPKGKTIGQIRKEWIAAGVTATAEGKRQIGDATVLARVTNPRVCGYRQYLSAQDRREQTNPWLPDLVMHVDGQPVIGVDELVESLFLEATRVTLEPVEKVEVDDAVYDVRLASLREEIKEVMARRKLGHPKKISTAAAMDLVAGLEEEIADLTYKARAVTADKIRRQSGATSILKEWNTYSIDMKRERLRRDISAVIVNKTRRGARFDPAVIEVAWAS